MKTTSQIYGQFLLSSQTNFTCTYLSSHYPGLDENSIYRFLHHNKVTPKIIWEKAKRSLIQSPHGYLIFDDTVLDKNYSFHIAGVRRQYSGNEHQVIKGIGLVSCLYYNPEADRYWVIDYRLFDPARDGKTKIDHVRDMLAMTLWRDVVYETVLMDTWYATIDVMMGIDSQRKIFYCPIRSNRQVDDSGGVKPYCPATALTWSSHDRKGGKLVKLKGFPRDKKVKLFRVTVSTDRTELIVTNNLTQHSSGDSQQETAARWHIEQFHREAKQVTGIEACECRDNRSQRNHIGICLQVWLCLSSIATATHQSIYQIKRQLLTNYMVTQLRNPSIVFC